ncbi:hypoxanthine phosphoribosyltransferase [Candidatus Beckwithbacteria bacterium]|nr:hypoxanthine phosphoribosyltransferase [Candidatus Beckwithbacteria bacterium]
MATPEQQADTIPSLSEIIPPHSEILISSEQIRRRVEELGKQISHDYAGKNPIFLCTLKGGFIFFADLVRNLDLQILGKFEIGFLRASSYVGQTSTQELKLIPTFDLTILKDRDIIIAEDLIDSGFSAETLIKMAREDWQTQSVEMIVLLFKLTGRNANGLRPRYIGYEIPDFWVFGVGPDDGGLTPGDTSRCFPDIRYYPS